MLRLWMSLLTGAWLSSCAYVTEKDLLEAWDPDGDGWPAPDDCRPDDKDYYPYAYDLRGDGCDHDCGTEPDDDGDDWPNAADCDPQNPDAYPCSPHEVDGDGVDLDCDGQDRARTDTCPGLDPDYPPETQPAPCNEPREGE